MTRADGTRLHLRDVATVVDGFAETDQSASFDNDPTILISVFRTGDQNALDIANLVYGYVEGADDVLPAGISLAVWQDQAEILKIRLGLMLRSGFSGFVLVFLLLALFLEVRLAFWGESGYPDLVLGSLRPDAGTRCDR